MSRRSRSNHTRKRGALIKGLAAAVYQVCAGLALPLSRMIKSDSLARAWFRIGRRILPEFEGDLAVTMSVHYEARGEVELAASYLRKALEGAPRSAIYHLMLAQRFHSLDHTAEAEIEYEMALTLHADPTVRLPSSKLSTQEQQQAQEGLAQVRRDGN